MRFKRKEMLPPREQGGNPQIQALRSDRPPQDSGMAFPSALAHGPVSPGRDFSLPLDTSVSQY